jgi:hypothetical protein
VTGFERWSVWITSVATFATGIVYLWMKYLLVSDDPFSVVNHPWQLVMLKLHILVAPLLIFSVGMVALRHIWRHLESGERAGRRSGMITVAVLGPMIVSGYLIQAVTHRGWLRAMAVSHIVTGVLYGLGLLVHQFTAGGRAARATRAEARRGRRRHAGGHLQAAGGTPKEGHGHRTVSRV